MRHESLNSFIYIHCFKIGVCVGAGVYQLRSDERNYNIISKNQSNHFLSADKIDAKKRRIFQA